MTLWTDLTAAQQQALLLCTHRKVTLGCELLDANLNLIADLSKQLQPGGSVKWTAATSDQRDSVQTTANIQLALSGDLAWGRQLLRLSKTVTDLDTGLSATGYLGAHMLPYPDRVAGQQIGLDDGTTGQLFALSCQDRSAQLDRIPGVDYTQPDGQTVVAAMKTVLDDAGVTGYLIDGTSASMMPTGGRTWPFAGGQQETWRAIFNDLADLIGYEPVYSGPTGLLRSGLLVDASQRAASQTLDVAVAGWVSPLAPKRTRKRDLSSTPNRWSIVWVDASGSPVTDASSPFEDTNYSIGDASVAALGGAPLGLRPAQQQQIQASSSADFLARCQAIVNADIRGVTEFDVSTVMWPELPHSPVFAYRDPATTGSQDPVKTVALTCEIELSEADSVWTLQEVAD